jgi:hypothetical protein
MSMRAAVVRSCAVGGPTSRPSSNTVRPRVYGAGGASRPPPSAVLSVRREKDQGRERCGIITGGVYRWSSKSSDSPMDSHDASEKETSVDLGMDAVKAASLRGTRVNVPTKCDIGCPIRGHSAKQGATEGVGVCVCVGLGELNLLSFFT